MIKQNYIQKLGLEGRNRWTGPKPKLLNPKEDLQIDIPFFVALSSKDDNAILTPVSDFTSSCDIPRNMSPVFKIIATLDNALVGVNENNDAIVFNDEHISLYKLTSDINLGAIPYDSVIVTETGKLSLITKDFTSCLQLPIGDEELSIFIDGVAINMLSQKPIVCYAWLPGLLFIYTGGGRPVNYAVFERPLHGVTIESNGDFLNFLILRREHNDK